MGTTISQAASGACAGFVEQVRQAVAEGRFIRMSLLRTAPGAPHRSSVRPIVLRGARHLSIVHRHASKDVTLNLLPDDAVQRIAGWIAEGVRSAHLQCDDSAFELAVSRKGRAVLRRLALSQAAARPAPVPEATHDAARTRWVDVARPYLQALGVTDAHHRVVPAMARKWRQINKFVEVFDGALARAGLTVQSPHGPEAAAPLRIVDFGAGKGYLTYALHDHLTATLGLPAEVTGVELRADLAADGAAIAARLCLHGLHFVAGDVRTRQPAPVDAVIALHACDTATDHALFLGVSSGARLIMCSPCCHKELRPQLLAPHPLAPLLRHGVHLGQQADMVTDGLRALLLEACGYATQVFEFVALEHSQKNKMILAVRRPAPVGVETAWRQVDDLKAFYGIRSQCFEALLRSQRGTTGVAHDADIPIRSVSASGVLPVSDPEATPS